MLIEKNHIPVNMEYYISLIAFIIFCMISIEDKDKSIKSKSNIRKEINDYKSKKFYENSYLYHIPNSRIRNDLSL